MKDPPEVEDQEEVLIPESILRQEDKLALRERAAVIISSSAADAGVLLWDYAGEGSDVGKGPPSRCFGCACPRHGLALLPPHHLAASQIQRAGSVGRGEIFFWASNKVERRYPLEPIVPLACTSNGVYIAGGGMSGKVYLWEVSSWSLLASWTAHHKGVSCLVFSDDNSLLISGADDGTVTVWPLMRIVDKGEERRATPLVVPKLFLYRWAGHRAPVTTILCSAGGSNAVVVTSSLDQTYKVWGIGTGKLLRSFRLQSAIISAVLHQNGQLFVGTRAGNIVVCFLDLWYTPSCTDVAKSSFSNISAHSASVTALALSEDGMSLISGSEDKFVRLWDARTGGLVKEHFAKGPVTNLLMVHEGYVSGHGKESELNFQKYRSFQSSCPGSLKSLVEEFTVLKDPVVQLHTSTSKLETKKGGYAYSALCLEKQLLEFQHESTPAALEMKISTLKHRNAEASKTNEEYLKQTELLRALCTEIRHSVVKEGH
ncbi:hypothetical protein L7F22_063213 [Adiantum nelumboides]|nr:hypothetical protein [Adiantum nelumboides]